MNVLVLTRYEENGASSRTRHYQFEACLKQRGISLTFAPLLSARYLNNLYGKPNSNSNHAPDKQSAATSLASSRPARALPGSQSILGGYFKRLQDVLRARHFDVIWCEKEILPFFPAWMENFLALAAPPIVLDFDDAWWLSYRKHKNKLLRAVLGRKFETLISRAAIITASNSFLVDDIRSMGGSDVREVPVALATKDYAAVAEQTASTAILNPASGPLKVGWIGTPITARCYLPMITPTLNRLSDENRCEVHLIGAGDSVPELKARRYEWSQENEIALIASHDIGIMPLHEDEFSNRKSAYKLLQYMACGKTVIGSPVGINQNLFEPFNGKPLGYSARDERQWYERIAYLADRRVERIEAGANCQNYIEVHHSIERQAGIIAKALRDASLRR